MSKQIAKELLQKKISNRNEYNFKSEIDLQLNNYVNIKEIIVFCKEKEYLKRDLLLLLKLKLQIKEEKIEWTIKQKKNIIDKNNYEKLKVLWCMSFSNINYARAQ